VPGGESKAPAKARGRTSKVAPTAYVSRVIVGVARELGRSVQTVARESFAVTLWTWYWLDDLTRETRMRDRFDRLDTASLSALAFHEPAKLRGVEMQLLSEAGELSDMMAETRARAEARVAAIARAVPVES
jgi:hypothetical protein